jgi:hypothetical protein
LLAIWAIQEGTKYGCEILVRARFKVISRVSSYLGEACGCSEYDRGPTGHRFERRESEPFKM